MRTEDGKIVQKCINGDSAAFGFLVDKYRESVYAFAYDRLGNFHDAEDVAQEVFIKAYQKLRTLKRYDSFLAWLYSIASNQCKMMLRALSRRPDNEFIEDQNPGALEKPSEDAYRQELVHEMVREALDSLPEIYRQALTLHYLGGMTSAEIARFVGTSPGNVRMRLTKARSLLREEILAMMRATFESQRLRAGFTFRIVEAVKKIKIQPLPRMTGLPWGLSLATGVIFITMIVNPYLSISNPQAAPGGAPLPGQTKVLRIGEIPVDVLKVSNIPLLASEGGDKNDNPSHEQNEFMIAPAGDGGDEEAVKKLFDDFADANVRRDFELMKTLWSHKDDVRLIGMVPPGVSVWVPQGWNMDYRGWDMVEHGYDVAFNVGIGGRFENAVIQIQGSKASATFSGEGWGGQREDSVVFFRKEGDAWKISMLDFDRLEVDRSGDESGEYVEIASEAEEGEVAKEFLSEDTDASGGVYVKAEGSPLLKLDIPEADEYTVWCRTYASNWPISYYSAKVDDIEFRGWAAVCTKWTWSQLNQEGVKGPKIFKLDKGKHSVALSSPTVAGPKNSLGGCKFDALYVTSNLSLRADQIQRRFDLTMRYVTQSAAETRGNVLTTWANIRKNEGWAGYE